MTLNGNNRFPCLTRLSFHQRVSPFARVCNANPQAADTARAIIVPFLPVAQRLHGVVQPPRLPIPLERLGHFLLFLGVRSSHCPHIGICYPLTRAATTVRGARHCLGFVAAGTALEVRYTAVSHFFLPLVRRAFGSSPDRALVSF